MSPVKTGDDKEARFIAGAGRDLQQSRIPPKVLGGLEVDAVLAQVGVAFGGIKLKVHAEPNLYRFDPLLTAEALAVGPDQIQRGIKVADHACAAEPLHRRRSSSLSTQPGSTGWLHQD